MSCWRGPRQVVWRWRRVSHEADCLMNACRPQQQCVRGWHCVPLYCLLTLRVRKVSQFRCRHSAQHAHTLHNVAAVTAVPHYSPCCAGLQSSLVCEYRYCLSSGTRRADQKKACRELLPSCETDWANTVGTPLLYQRRCNNSTSALTLSARLHRNPVEPITNTNNTAHCTLAQYEHSTRFQTSN